MHDVFDRLPVFTQWEINTAAAIIAAAVAVLHYELASARFWKVFGAAWCVSSVLVLSAANYHFARIIARQQAELAIARKAIASTVVLSGDGLSGYIDSSRCDYKIRLSDGCEIEWSSCNDRRNTSMSTEIRRGQGSKDQYGKETAGINRFNF